MKAFRTSISILGLLFGLLCLGLLVILFVLPDTAIHANCKPPNCYQKDLLFLASLLTANMVTSIWHFLVSGLERLTKSATLLVAAALVVAAVTSLELINGPTDKVTHISWLSWGGIVLNLLYAAIVIVHIRRRAAA
jgi:hypothetical protein